MKASSNPFLNFIQVISTQSSHGEQLNDSFLRIFLSKKKLFLIVFFIVFVAEDYGIFDKFFSIIFFKK